MTPDDSADLARRFGGMDRLYGPAAAAAMRAAHVAVVGVGGVGSWAVEALARSGVGRLSLIDLDHVTESNINRQVQATAPTVGQAKVQALAERIALIHPGCVVQGIEEFVTPDNWPALLAGAEQGGQAVDVVIDACDQVRTKATLAAWSLRQRRALVVCGAAGGKRRAQAVELDDLAQTTHDSLLAQLRYRLRREHGAPRDGRIGVACVFSREAVAPPDPACLLDGGDGSLNCHGYGSVVTVTATFGLVAAGWALEWLARPGAKAAVAHSAGSPAPL